LRTIITLLEQGDACIKGIKNNDAMDSKRTRCSCQCYYWCISFPKYAVSDQSRNNEAWQRTNKHGFEHSYGAYSLPTPMQISSTNLSRKLNLTNFPTQSLDRNRIKEIFATTTRNFNMLAYRLLGSHCEAAGGTE